MIVTDAKILKGDLQRLIEREIAKFEKTSGTRVTGIKIDKTLTKDGFEKPLIEKRIKIRCEI